MDFNISLSTNGDISPLEGAWITLDGHWKKTDREGLASFYTSGNSIDVSIESPGMGSTNYTLNVTEDLQINEMFSIESPVTSISVTNEYPMIEWSPNLTNVVYEVLYNTNLIAGAGWQYLGAVSNNVGHFVDTNRYPALFYKVKLLLPD